VRRVLVVVLVGFMSLFLAPIQAGAAPLIWDVYAIPSVLGPAGGTVTVLALETSLVPEHLCWHLYQAPAGLGLVGATSRGCCSICHVRGTTRPMGHSYHLADLGQLVVPQCVQRLHG